MSEIALREIINYVKQNFPSTIIDEVTGATVTINQNSILQEKLRLFEEQIEKRIRRTARMQMDRTGEDDLLRAYQDGVIEALEEILGEK